jgi:CRISPR system Cascade subunit CasA
MSDDEVRSFDLIDQPWVLVRDLHGEVRELSLLDTLAEAHTLECLVGELPTQVFAMTRLLLAILHRAVNGPGDVDEWEQLWTAPQLPLDLVTDYLKRYRDRFDLLHPDTPFFQVAGLRTARDEMSDLSKLIADVPNGRPFFSTRLARELSLSFSEAARWVVHCHAFDFSGIKSGAVGDPRIKGGKGYPIGTGWSGYLGGVLAEGATLRETLLLNLVASGFADLRQWRDTDAPAWERPQPGPAPDPATGDKAAAQGSSRAPTGPTDLYTWQSRRIRLAWQNGRVVGVLVANGNQITPQNRYQVEPLTGWRRSEAQEKKLRLATVYMPREHDPQRVIWRGLQSLLPGGTGIQRENAAPGLAPTVLNWIGALTDDEVLEPNFPVRIRTIGMSYGNQRAVTVDVTDDVLSLRALLLHQGASTLVGIVLACVTAADKAARALGGLAGTIAVARGGESEGPRTRANELAYAELDIRFRRWIASLSSDTDPSLAQLAWHQDVREAIRDLSRAELDRAPVSALVGRSVNSRLVTSAHAEGRFHRDLHAAVPLAYADTSTEHSTPPPATLQDGPSV